MKKMLSWKKEKIEHSLQFQLQGELSRNTLLPFWKEWKNTSSEGKQFFSVTKLQDDEIVWDLQGVSRIDSAGFALVCELLQASREMKPKSVILKNAPEQLFTLADLMGLSQWLKPFLVNNPF